MLGGACLTSKTTITSRLFVVLAAQRWNKLPADSSPARKSTFSITGWTLCADCNRQCIKMEIWKLDKLSLVSKCCRNIAEDFILFEFTWVRCLCLVHKVIFSVCTKLRIKTSVDKWSAVYSIETIRKTESLSQSERWNGLMTFISNLNQQMVRFAEPSGKSYSVLWKDRQYLTDDWSNHLSITGHQANISINLFYITGKQTGNTWRGMLSFYL